jgi:hypothetical protein
MVGQGWIASEATQEHLQNLVSQGYITTAELVTCHMPNDPSSPVLAGGYAVSCATFYERGFGIPSHRFLHSLLQFYGLELHHLTPPGILHITTFVTLCEAYMEIEPHFFCARLQQGSGAEVMVLDSADIFIRSEHGVDPSMDHISGRW